MDNLVLVLSYALFPVAATILGGIVAAFRSPGPKTSSAIQHFAGGVVFAAVATELLPDIIHERAQFPIGIGFALGIAVMLGVKRLAERYGGEGEAEGGPAESTGAGALGLIVTVGVDVVIDGLLIGIGFAAGGKAGVLLTIALTIELLFLGLSAATALSRAGSPPAKMIGTIVVIALLLLVGAAAGTTLLAGLSGAPFVIVMAFGTAALLYLVTEELLVEAHGVPETALITSSFFVGFWVMLMIDMAELPV